MPPVRLKRTRKKRFRVGSEVFATQKALRSRTQEILNRRSGPRRITDPDDMRFLLDLFKRHPQYQIKKGNGISEVHVRINPQWHTRSFWIRRQDKSWMDISYRECIRPCPQGTRFASACRSAIKAQIDAYKAHEFTSQTCELCNEMINTKDEIHVDHAEPQFHALVSDFIQTHGIDVRTVAISSDDAAIVQFCDAFSDQHLERQFSEYHARHATLRIVHAQCNMRRART